jgi:hypothetical protein
VGYARENPPSNWSGLDLIQAGPELYYGWVADNDHPVFWHWCTDGQRWLAQGTENHALVSREPLHLEPSLHWTCCGLHGWVRDGCWAGAG